ncbi:MAG TPA: glycosyltransferase [bacterium]|nr:glycosyltransferase [bacterium]
MNDRRNVLITCAAQNAALACARSLHRAGWRVSLVDHDVRAKGFASRACDHYEVLPSPLEEPERYAQQIIAYLNRNTVELLIPVTDAAIFALLPFKKTLERLTKIPWPSPEALHAAVDKVQTFNLAERLGFPLPAGVTIDDPQAALPALPYPVAIKPQQLGEGGKLAVRYADDEDALRAVFASWPGDAFPALVQERIVGPGEGYFGVWRHGEPVVECAHRRLRENPPSGGVSTLREAIELPDDMRELARKLLGEWRWHGPAMVEFKRSRRDGKPYLIEVNGRLWGSLQLAIDAGIDIPVAAAAVALGEDVPPMHYTPGVRTRWLKGDLDALLSRWRKTADLPPDAPSRGAWTRAFLLDFLNPNIYYDSWRWRDLRPFFREIVAWQKNILRLLLRKIGNRRSPALMMHVHSTYSYDGELSVREIARICRKKGVRVCCLTEHSDRLTQEQVDQLAAECAEISDDSLLLVPGIEFSMPGGLHLIGYGVTDLLTTSDPRTLCREIRERGGLAVLAHPESGMPGADPALALDLDGMEVWNTGRDGTFVPSPRRLNDHRTARLHNPSLLAFHGDDFHRPANLRRVRTRLTQRDLAAPLTWTVVREALRAGRFRFGNGLVRVKPGGASRWRTAAYRLFVSLVDTVRPWRQRWRNRWRVSHWDFMGCPHVDCPARTEPDGEYFCWRAVGSFAGHDCRHRPGCPADCRECDYYRYANQKTLGEKRLRILHLIETGNPGGAEHLMINLIRHLDPERFSSQVVLIKEGWLAEQFRALGVQVTVLPLARRFNWRFVLSLLRLVRRRKIDLLHSHEFTMNVYSFFVRLLIGKPTVATVHGNLSYIAARYRRRFAYRSVAQLAGPLLVVSEEMKEQVGRLFDLEEKHLRVIHNGAEVPARLADKRKRAIWRKELGLPADGFLVGVIGSLYPVKGQGTLLRAMPRLIAAVPDIHLAVVGRGDMRAALERQAADLGIAEYVTFTGYREDAREKLACFDLIVVPSKYEGLSLLVVESMAAGRPVIATHVGGNPEAIEDGVSGLLVPPDDPEVLADACLHVIGDPALAKRLGREARRRVAERFSLRRMVEQYQNLYLRTLGRDR